MRENMLLLYNKYLQISKLGWVKGISNTKGNIGITFEHLLEKEKENFPLPDYLGFEIKTYENKTRELIHLFNLTPDGDYLFPIPRILKKLGCPDKEKPQYKIFYRSFGARKYTSIGLFKKGKLIMNYSQEKVELHVYDEKNRDIEIGVSWSFESLKERLYLKLGYLAFIKADSKIINDEKYFYYNKIKFYKLKSFKKFLYLIDHNYIEATFKIGVFKEEKREGQIYDHGTDFSIKVYNISDLFEEIKVN